MRKLLTPHIFWVADQAYQRLLVTRNQQCIAVSGESGAGKTESTKLIVQHIIQLCRNDLDKELQKKIIEVLLYFLNYTEYLFDWFFTFPK